MVERFFYPVNNKHDLVLKFVDNFTRVRNMISPHYVILDILFARHFKLSFYVALGNDKFKI